MDLQKDLEEYKRTCNMSSDGNFEMEKEIIIRSLDHCRYKLEHISVKDLPIGDQVSLDVETKHPVVIHMDLDEEISEDPALEFDNFKTGNGVRPTSQPEFSHDKDIPDRDQEKVYDFVMSKDRTLPQQLSPEYVQIIRRQWVCIASLVLSTLLLVVIVIVVLVLTSPED